MQEGNPLVSVIVPTYRRERLLCETVADVLAQTYRPMELVVVDQTPAHDEETRLYLDRVADQIRLLRVEPPGIPRARNAGVLAARGDVVLFVDDDVVLPPEFVATHARRYREARIGGVAGRVVVSADVARPLVEPPPATGVDFDRTEPGDAAFARGCNMSFRKDLLVRAGLFDEAYSGHTAGEEEDACFAVRRLGYRIAFDPEAWLVHRYERQGGSRVAIPESGSHVSYYRNKVYFALKNVGGLDFWRVLWDTYRSGAWSSEARARGVSEVLRRQCLFAQGVGQGIHLFRRRGRRERPLPYGHA